MKKRYRTTLAALMLLSFAPPLLAAKGGVSLIPWSDAPYCTGQPNDQTLNEFREEVSYVLKRGFPSNYRVNVCVYRESDAFPGGSPGSLIATLDAENLQGLPTQPHTWSGDVACDLTNDAPCIRTRQVQLYLPGTHPEAVRLPSDPADNAKRIVAIVRDTSI
jgi:hypothetical protein